MNELRWAAAAILLPNGKVLVAGGSGDTSLTPVRTAELYDATTAKWSFTGSMSQERRAFTLTLLSNGKVLAVGGFGSNGVMSVVELYDPATETWTSTGSLRAARTSHTATPLPNGKVLVAGGLGVASPQSGIAPADPVLASAELYDLVTGVWTLTGSMGQGRETHTSTLLLDGRVLAAGGVSYFGGLFITSAELYNPTDGKWSPTFPLISGRSDHIAALLPNGSVLIAGGFNTSDTGPTTELFNPKSVVSFSALLTEPASQAGGAFQFTFRNTPGLSFTVLSTTNVAIPVAEWTALGKAVEVSPGHYHFTDFNSGTHMFYRTRSD